MTEHRLGVAQIGAGGIGKHHLRCYTNIPEIRVAGVYDINVAATEAAAKEFEIERVYRTLDEALSDVDVDFVTVATPTGVHAEVVIQALNAGKHVLCEKPLAPTAADIERIITARDASGRLLMTGQHQRFEASTVAIQQWIKAGRLGDCYYARAQWLRRRRVPATPGFITKKLAGLGPGADLGVHLIDSSLFLLGHPKPVSVSGVAGCKLAHGTPRLNEWGRFDPQLYDVEDYAMGFIRFETGAALTIETSWMLNMHEPELTRLSLFGTVGGVEWPSAKMVHEDAGGLTIGELQSVAGDNGHTNEFRAFVAAIREGAPSPVPPEQSLVNARILDGLYASSETGREVRLDG